MTLAFCNLILHYSTARLSWITIKSLHRNRTKHNDITPVEYEILMGWTLLAFHSIYVNTGVEYPLTFIIPFYYYFKLIVLGATFVLPSLMALNPIQRLTNSGANGGSNPLVVAWFNLLIVPGVHRIHEAMDYDPKRWVVEQLSMLPFLLLDLFIVPGILLTDEEREDIRLRRRSETSWVSVEDAKMKDDAIKVPPPGLFQRDDLFPANKTAPGSGIMSPPGKQVSSSKIAPSPKTPELTPLFFPRTSPRLNKTSSDTYISSPAAISRVATTALRLRRFSREHEGSKTPAVKLTPRMDEAAVSDATKKMAVSDDNPDTIEEVTEDGTPNIADEVTQEDSGNIEDKFMEDDTGNIADELMEDAEPSPEKDEFKQPTLADKPTFDRYDRMKASKEMKPIRKQRFSLDTENNPPNHPTGTIKPKRGRHERLSLGDQIRELVTGDVNIRLRDHLFDLELPSVPCTTPRHASPPSYRQNFDSRFNTVGDVIKAVDSSKVTTRRRSSRLAKKQSID